jgi:N-acetylglucosamine-6-sulfatase
LPRTRIGASIASVLAVCLLSGCGEHGSGEAAGGRGPAQPNVLVVMTDDQAIAGWLDAMPRIRREIVRRGTTFDESFVSNPLCCPSRATFLTGQYGHNNGVLENETGYPVLRKPGWVLPAWLQRAGYRTAHVGKWLHHYEDEPGTDAGIKPPPGWNEWDGLLRAEYYDYEMSVDGKVKSFSERPSDYADDVISRYGLRFLRSNDHRPFFLSLAYLAPHLDEATPAALAGRCTGYATPAPGHLPDADEPGFRRSPATNEADVSDKPGFLSGLPTLGNAELSAIDQAFRCEQASMRAVDRGVARILTHLRRAGELDETLVVVTSDNGFFHGEHRILKGKSLPYAAATHVPLVIRPPTGADAPGAGTTSAELVANVDLAPTILDYTGASPCVAKKKCRELDGLSLKPLIEGGDSAWPAPREILLESKKQTKGECGWSALRSQTYLYSAYRVRSPGGVHPCVRAPGELYDLDRDPHELENVADDPGYADVRDELAERLAQLKGCSGEGCR